MTTSPIVRATIAGLAMLAIAGCHHKPGGKHAADTTKTTEDAKATIAGIMAAYNAHDAVKAASYDAPDYVSMFHGFGTAVGPAADIESMKQQFQDPAARFDLTVNAVDVAKSGEMVVVRSAYVYSFTNPTTKAIATETGNWVAGMKRQPDGSLKLAWSIGADVPKATAAPAPAATRAP